MKYQIKHIDFIEESLLEQLESVNINNTDDIIEAANSEVKRKSLETKTGISLKELEFLASVSDLVRIKGVAVKTATKLINSCNFKCVQEIAQFDVPDNNINTQAGAAFLEERLKNCQISKNRFLEIAEEAAELKPRLVFEDVSEIVELNNNFISEIKKQINTSGKWETKSLLFAFTLVFLTALIALAIFFYPIYHKYKYLDGLYQEILNVELFMPAFWLKVFSLIGVILIIVTIVVSFLVLWQIVQRWFKLLIYQILFRKEVFKRAFLRLDFLDLIKLHKKSTNRLAFLAVLFIVSVLVILFIEGFEGVNHLIWPIILFLIFLIALLYFNMYKFYNRIKGLQKSVSEVYQRILFVSQIEVFFSIFVLIIGLNIVLPLALEVVALFEKEIVIKASQRKHQEALKQINFEEVDPDIIENVEETLENIFIMKPTFDFHEEGIESLKMVLRDFPDFIKTIFGALLVALILSFSIPYFKFTGLRSGITLLFVIGISMAASYIVERKFSAWFFIEDSLTMRYLIIFIFSFWFAILFDWLYKILSFDKQECPNCKNLVEKHHNFCSGCGLIKN